MINTPARAGAALGLTRSNLVLEPQFKLTTLGLYPLFGFAPPEPPPAPEFGEPFLDYDSPLFKFLGGDVLIRKFIDRNSKV